LVGRVRFAASLENCALDADVLAITTPWPEFQALPAAAMRPATGRPKTVIDCWRILPRSAFESVCEYATLGLGSAGGEMPSALEVLAKAQLQGRGD